MQISSFFRRTHTPGSFFRLVVTLLASGWILQASNSVAGSVYQRKGDSAIPVRAAYVSARSLDGRLIATSRSAGNGAYSLHGLPPARILLAAWLPGFYTVRAAGRAGTRVLVDCTSGCFEQAFDFELVRGGAVSGVIVDELREPVEGARVSARLLNTAISGEKNLVEDTTDDRGRFRLAGLRSGAYAVTAQGRVPERQRVHRTLHVEVSEGREINGLSITLGGDTVFRVSGGVTGLSFSEYTLVRVVLKPAGFTGQQLAAVANEEGRFEFPAIPAGPYEASINAIQDGSSGRVRRFLDVIDVNGDMEGLVLRPRASADVEAAVEFAAEVESRPFPVLFKAHEGGHSRWFRATGEGKFGLEGLSAGTYTIEARSRSAYVKGVRRGDQIEPADEVVLSPGTNRLTVVVAADHGEVFGTIRDPSDGKPLPHARVALEGRGVKNFVQADQAGRFLFGEVIPGEYRICAWADISPEEIANEAAWEAAGCSDNIIPIDPESEVEINLTAAP